MKTFTIHVVALVALVLFGAWSVGANSFRPACIGTTSAGDVVGPSSSTDNAIARFDGTTGKLLQDSPCVVSDTGVLTCGTANVGLRASVTPGALAIDWSTAMTFQKTIAVNSTFTFSNTTDGQMIFVRVTAGAGNTVMWPTVQWSGGAPPVQTSGGTDVYTFVKIGSTIYGSVIPAVS